jgi:hypothetical protein
VHGCSSQLLGEGLLDPLPRVVCGGGVIALAPVVKKSMPGAGVLDQLVPNVGGAERTDDRLPLLGWHVWSCSPTSSSTRARMPGVSASVGSGGLSGISVVGIHPP